MRSGSQGSPLYIGIKKYIWIISWVIASSMACRKPDRQYQLMPYFKLSVSCRNVQFHLFFSICVLLHVSNEELPVT